jgi:hypothetical protein
MREWTLSNRIRKARSTSQAVYLTQASISRYTETSLSWSAQFEENRIREAREKLNAREEARLTRILSIHKYMPRTMFAW